MLRNHIFRSPKYVATALLHVPNRHDVDPFNNSTERSQLDFLLATY